MTKRYFQFCPRCGRRLIRRKDWSSEPVRPSCPTGHFTFYRNPLGATDAVIVRDGKILLVRRGRNPKKGRYDFPGGFMNGFERPQRTVVREVKEEVGLHFVPKHLIGVYINDQYWWQGQRVPAVVMSYFGTARGRIRLNDEVKRPQWIPLTRNITMAFQYQNQTLRDLKKLLRLKSTPLTP